MNERQEFLITALPVTLLSAVSTQSTVIPHYADGEGWTTLIVLVNPTDTTLTGAVQFYSEGTDTAAGQPISISANGTTATSFSYDIPARSFRRFRTDGSGASIRTGSVRVSPAAGSNAPGGLAIFAFRPAGAVVSEAGIPLVPSGTSFQLYVEAAGTFGQAGSMQSGVAIANSGSGSITANLELFNLDGSSTGLARSVTVPGNGHIAAFVNSLFPSLSATFQGTLRVTASTGSLSAVGLRAKYNELQDFLITTTPAANRNDPPVTGELVFPHVANDGGYTAQFILFGTSGQAVNASVRFFSQSGLALPIGIR